MDELISREKVLALSHDIVFNKEKPNEYRHRCIDATEVKLIPCVNAKPIVHGRWKGAGFGDIECCVCGGVVSSHNYRYCPFCGAEMDEYTE